MKYIIAIDPGKNGGFAFGRTDLRPMVVRMPKRIEDIGKQLKVLVSHADQCEIVVYLEKVHSMPHQGVVSVFTFGQWYGALIGAITTLGLDLRHVTPQEWQKSFTFKEKRKDVGREEWKRVLKRKAQRLYKRIKLTGCTADAILIYNYAARILGES